MVVVTGDVLERKVLLLDIRALELVDEASLPEDVISAVEDVVPDGLAITLVSSDLDERTGSPGSVDTTMFCPEAALLVFVDSIGLLDFSVVLDLVICKVFLPLVICLIVVFSVMSGFDVTILTVVTSFVVIGFVVTPLTVVAGFFVTTLTVVTGLVVTTFIVVTGFVVTTFIVGASVVVEPPVVETPIELVSDPAPTEDPTVTISVVVPLTLAALELEATV